MSVKSRVAKLEHKRTGPCKYCAGRKDRGRVLIAHQNEDGPVTFNPKVGHVPPTPCPRCGRDTNVCIVIHRTSKWSIRSGRIERACREIRPADSLDEPERPRCGTEPDRRPAPWLQSLL